MEPVYGVIRMIAAWVAGAVILWLTGISQAIGLGELPPESKVVLAQLLNVLFSAAYYFGVRYLQTFRGLRWVGYGLLLNRNPVDRGW